MSQLSLVVGGPRRGEVWLFSWAGIVPCSPPLHAEPFSLSERVDHCLDGILV